MFPRECGTKRALATPAAALAHGRQHLWPSSLPVSVRPTVGPCSCPALSQGAGAGHVWRRHGVRSYLFPRRQTGLRPLLTVRTGWEVRQVCRLCSSVEPCASGVGRPPGACSWVHGAETLGLAGIVGPPGFDIPKADETDRWAWRGKEVASQFQVSFWET